MPAIKPKLGRTSLGPFALDSTLGPDPPAEPEEGGVKGWMQRGSFKSPLAATRSTSLPVSRSAQRAVEAAAAAAIATEAVHDPQHKFQQHVAMLRHGSRRWAANVRAAVRGLREPRLSMDGGAEGAGNDGERGAPKKMVLSMRELEAAMGHSLGVYGDLEDYVGSTPLQSYYAAIEKFTGVPEADVLFAVWRSQAFEPAHYLAIDRARRKVVICVRCVCRGLDRQSEAVCVCAWRLGGAAPPVSSCTPPLPPPTRYAPTGCQLCSGGRGGA